KKWSCLYVAWLRNAYKCCHDIAFWICLFCIVHRIFHWQYTSYNWFFYYVWLTYFDCSWRGYYWFYTRYRVAPATDSLYYHHIDWGYFIALSFIQPEST